MRTARFLLLPECWKNVLHCTTVTGSVQGFAESRWCLETVCQSQVAAGPYRSRAHGQWPLPPSLGVSCTTFDGLCWVKYKPIWYQLYYAARRHVSADSVRVQVFYKLTLSHRMSRADLASRVILMLQLLILVGTSAVIAVDAAILSDVSQLDILTYFVEKTEQKP